MNVGLTDLRDLLWKCVSQLLMASEDLGSIIIVGFKDVD